MANPFKEGDWVRRTGWGGGGVEGLEGEVVSSLGEQIKVRFFDQIVAPGESVWWDSYGALHQRFELVARPEAWDELELQ